MLNQDADANPPVPATGVHDADRRQRVRRIGSVLYLIILGLVFGKSLLSLVGYAAETPLFSYILSIPVCVAFLVAIRRNDLPTVYVCSPAWALIPLLSGLAAWFAGSGWRIGAWTFSYVDQLSLMAFAFVCFLIAGGFLFLGQKWMVAASFPAAFLFFVVPLPDGVLEWMETSLQSASAEAADLFFFISRTPVMREGVFFELPGFSMQVGQECSGIQASWVLFISTVLASALFLKSPWRRAVLILAVVPLGILRNGFRIMVIGLLCIHQGPHMIDSVIHRKGGPLFLALSLIPLAIILWWLRKGERPGRGSPASGGSK